MRSWSPRGGLVCTARKLIEGQHAVQAAGCGRHRPRREDVEGVHRARSAAREAPGMGPDRHVPDRRGARHARARRGPPSRLPAGGVRRDGRRRVRRLPAVDGVREGRSRPRHRDARGRARHGSHPRRLHGRAEGGVAEPDRGGGTDCRLRRDGARGRVERPEPQDRSHAHHRRRRPRHPLPPERREAVHLERVDRGPLHDSRKGAGRPHLLRRRTQHRRPHAGAPRDQARHQAVGHRAGAAAGRGHPRLATSWARARATA